MKCRILVVDDEESIRFTFSQFLAAAGYEVDVASSLHEAMSCLEAESLTDAGSYDVVFLDIFLGRDNGIELLKRAKEVNPNCPVIMITGSPEISTAAASVRHAAYDYLVKPVTKDALVHHAHKAAAYKTALDEKDRYQKRIQTVFQSVQEGLLVFDASLNLIDLNSSAGQMLGLDDADIGKSLGVLAEGRNGHLLEAFKELLESRFEGELYKLEFPRDSGEPLTLGVSITPLKSAAGQENDVVMVIRNETPQRRLAAVG